MSNIIKEESDNGASKISKYIIELGMIAKINEKEEFIKGFGLLSYIPSKKIKALVTYNHILNFDLLNEGKKLILDINGEIKELDMKINRYKYTYKDLDITIIEILDIDNINDYLELDKSLDSRNYIDNDIISIPLKEKKEIKSSFGKIKGKINDNYTCNIESINEGLIILKENYKLIGIIKGNNDKEELEFIPINAIINKINFIKCIYEIKKDDIGKEIRIINNNYQNEEMQKEIKVIINGEIKSNIFTNKFDIEGNHLIYIFSDNLLTNMSFMFRDCTLLKEISFSAFDTKKVRHMQCLFTNCISLEQLDLSSFDTSQVTNMASMFRNCSSLKQLDLTSFNTDKVYNMPFMFEKCSSLKELNLQTFNTSEADNMEKMFSDCSSLEQLNLSSFNTDKVTKFNNMFMNCSSLKKINLSSFNTNQAEDMAFMFENCHSLQELDLSIFNTNNVTDMTGMFCNCFSMKKLNLSSFNTDKVTNMRIIFKSIKKSCKIKCKDVRILNEFKKEAGGCTII